MKLIWILNYLSLAFVLGYFVSLDTDEASGFDNRFFWAGEGVFLGLLFALLLPERKILTALAGVAVMLGIGFLCWILKILRECDVMLLCVVGAFCGWKLGLSCLIEAVVIGTVLRIPWALRRLWKKQEEKKEFPFSLAIAIACLAGEIFGCL